MINTLFQVSGVTYSPKSIQINKTMSVFRDFKTTSSVWGQIAWPFATAIISGLGAWVIASVVK